MSKLETVSLRHGALVPTVHRLGAQEPDLHDTVYVAPGAHVIGDVKLEAHVSVWFNAVIRGDQQTILIRARANIQDQVTIHAEHDVVEIGAGATVGHGAILHGCTVGESTVIGMGAILLDGAKVGSRCFIAAGTLIPPHMEIPDGSVVMGSPGKRVRDVTAKELDWALHNTKKYMQKAERYRQELDLPARKSNG